MKRTCNRCKFIKDISHFISCRYIVVKTTLNCYKCRYSNSARFIAREHNIKEQILEKLKSEFINKKKLHNIYIIQKRRCFLCTRRVCIPLLYVNKFDNESYYKNNIFLSCFYCYNLRDDYEDVYEFINKLHETNYPFNKSNLEETIRPVENLTFIQQLLGI